MGSTIRSFLSRLFGVDREVGNVQDFLKSLSSLIRVTVTGKTIQTDGAIFADLPSNILGCFCTMVKVHSSDTGCDACTCIT